MARLPRSSGVLAHPSSLPGELGIGDLGAPTDRLLDFLQQAGQTLWQVLPLGPTGAGASPYASPSAFAGNPLLLAMEPLVEAGLLNHEALQPLRELPRDRVDFASVARIKNDLLRVASLRLRELSSHPWRLEIEEFRQAERNWLIDYANFSAISQRERKPWWHWPEELRDRDTFALRDLRAGELREAVEQEEFAQFLFFREWQSVCDRAHARSIRIVGDIPIFVARDSSDVWAHRRLFKVAPDGTPSVVAGVPPDYFSERGQLWGNPLHKWEAIKAEDYGWWIERFRQLLRMVDIVRVDHFRGFQAAWEVPADAPDATSGSWVAGPGHDLFRSVDKALGRPVPILAEDLGVITDDVRAMLAELGYPGMKVLQFAFGDDARNPYLPHNFDNPNCVVYTGTHDNDTTRGWFGKASEPERDIVRRYLGRDGADITWDFIRLALSSVADTAILPLQDVLDLGTEARMNIPGQADGNWGWRATEGQLQPHIAHRLADLTRTYKR